MGLGSETFIVAMMRTSVARSWQRLAWYVNLVGGVTLVTVQRAPSPSHCFAMGPSLSRKRARGFWVFSYLVLGRLRVRLVGVWECWVEDYRASPLAALVIA